MGLRAPVSSKVNQWTLLVGALPAVYAMSAGGWAGMPLDSRQGHEILLTAAQSLFALAVLLDLKFSWKEAAVSGILFLLQPFFTSAHARDVFVVIYLVGAAAVFVWGNRWAGAKAIVRRAFGKE